MAQVAKGADDEGPKQNSEEDQDLRADVLEGELEQSYRSKVGEPSLCDRLTSSTLVFGDFMDTADL